MTPATHITTDTPSARTQLRRRTDYGLRTTDYRAKRPDYGAKRPDYRAKRSDYGR